MTKTFKILSAISFIALAIVLTFVGVWALSDLDFTVGGNITYTAPEPVTPEEVSYLTFSYNNSSKKATLIGCNTSVTLSTIVIPAKIVYNEIEYTVVSIQGKYDDDVGMVGVFYGCNLVEEVIISSGVETIGDSAFAKCSTLSKITIPNSVTSIGTSAFNNCIALTEIIIPDSVTTIGGQAFFYCTGLTSLIIPNNVTSIEYSLFYGCTGLQEITIPQGVTSIGNAVFAYCSSLTTINLRATIPPSFGKDMFTDASSSFTIYVPTDSVEAYKSASGWSDFASQIQGKDFK